MATNSQFTSKTKDTFVIKPDEEEQKLADMLRKGGSNQEQINQALIHRRNIRTNIGAEGTSEPASTQGANLSKPFGGMSKRAVLTDAFNKGMTDPKELEKIESLYDKLVGEDAMDIPEDLSILSYEEQQNVKEKVKFQIAQQAQNLASATERSTVTGTLATLDSGQEIVDMLDNVSTGFGTGTQREGIKVFGIKIPGTRRFGKTTEEEDLFNAKAEVFAAQFRKAISGTAVSDKEKEDLMKFLPSESKTKQENIAGIQAISDFLINESSYTIGIDMKPLKPSSGNSDPLGLNSSKRSKDNPLGI